MSRRSNPTCSRASAIRPRAGCGSRRWISGCRRRSRLGVGILWWIAIGFVAGAFARAVTKGAPDAGCIFTTVSGVIGARIGGALFNAVGDHDIGDSLLGSMFVAFIGPC